MVNNDNKVKILLISPLPPPAGGIATWTEKFIRWSKTNYIDVDIINTSVIGKRAKKINNSRSYFDEFKRTINIINTLINKLNKDYPLVAHLNTSCGKFGIVRDFFCAAIIKKRGVPLVVHYHCNIEDQLKNPIQKFYFRKLSTFASANIVLNKQSKIYIEQVCRQNSKVLSNFIDDEYIINNGKNINDKIQSIAFIGHVQKSKGIIEIFEVAEKFHNIKFTLAGPISDEVQGLKKPDNILLAGVISHSEVRSLLHTTDIFLFPTYSEGFSVALLEAMAMGVPIITTPVGANADMIESRGGIIVQKKNCKDIEQAIIRLQDKEYRKKMSEWNIGKVKKKYLVNDVLNELLVIYNDVISAKCSNI